MRSYNPLLVMSLITLMFGSDRAWAAEQFTKMYPPVLQESVQAVAIDSAGNRYVARSLGSSQSQDCNPGPGVDITPFAVGDSIITRFNADGSYAWTQILRSAITNSAAEVTTDGITVYITGYFTGNLQVGLAGTVVNSVGGTFVVALNCSDGAAKSGWGLLGSGIQTFGANKTTYGFGVIADGTSVYVTGYFLGSGAQIGMAGTAVSSLGNWETFVIALNAANGAAKSGWGLSGSGIQTFGGTGSDHGQGIATDGTNVYVTGYFQGSAQIGATGTAVSCSGVFDAFILALNCSDGTARSGWGISGSGIQTFGGTGSDQGYGIATDGTNVYVTGSFAESARIGTAGTAINSAGSGDAFVIALNGSDGLVKNGWGVAASGIQTFGGSSNDIGRAVAIDGQNLYVAGDFVGSARIGFAGAIVASSGDDDAFVIALNCSDGAARSDWGLSGSGVQIFGGTFYEDVLGVVIDSTNVFIYGSFNSPDAGVGGLGRCESSLGSSGFLLPLNKATGITPLPLFTSALSVLTIKGVAVSHTLNAINNPTEFNALNLPQGLKYVAGSITGVLTTTGTYSVVISATNSAGTIYGTLTIIVIEDQVANAHPPVIQGEALQGQLVTLDAAGNHYVTGQFYGIKDFNPGLGVDARISKSNDAFVTRFNADGSYAWTQTFSGDFTGAKGLAIATDEEYVYVTGEIYGHAQIGDTGKVINANSDRGFVIALSCVDGAPRNGWGRLGSGIQTLGGTGYGIAIDGTCLYVTGEFDDLIQIGATGTFFNSAGGTDAFVIALNCSDGAARSGWGLFGSGIQTFGGLGDDGGYGLATDGTRVFATGYFTGTAIIGKSGYAPLISSAGGNDVFVISLNCSNGAATTGWGRAGSGIQTFGGTSADVGYGVATDGTTVFATGYFAGTARIAGLGTGISGSFGNDGFVIALNTTNGAAKSNWGRSSSGIQTFGGSSNDCGYGVATDGLSVYATGYFAGSARIGATGTFVSSAGENDSLTVALNSADGLSLSGWGHSGSGIQTFGGAADDKSFGIALAGGQIYLRGSFYSSEAGISGPGNIDSSNFNGFLLSLDKATGASANAKPLITSPLNVRAGVGAPFNYTISATNSPTSYAAVNLPAGLSLTGSAITGSLTAADTFTTIISATNANGTAYASLSINSYNGRVANVYPPVIAGSALAVAIDAAGNRYVAGFSYTQGLDFNPGVGVDVPLATGENGFVTRYNADGSYAWTQTFSANHTSGVATDGTNVYVVGNFNGTGQIGASGTVVAGSGHLEVFVIALNCADGTASNWGRSGSGIQTFGGTNNDWAYGVITDGATVYVTGDFVGSARIGGIGTAVTSAGSTDAFVIALNCSDGLAKSGWGISGSGIQSFGGTSSDRGYGVVADGTTLYVTGHFSGSARIGASGTAVSGGGTHDCFIIALNSSDGTAKNSWGRFGSGIQTFGGFLSIGKGIATDGTTVYATGYFQGSAQIGASGTVIACSGSTDFFVIALNSSDGTAKSGWGKSASGIQTFGGRTAEGTGIIADGDSVYATGYFQGIGQIGATGPTVMSAGSTDAFAIALKSSDGTPKVGWGLSGSGAQTFGGKLSDFGWGVASYNANIYVCGSFLGENAGVGGTGQFSADDNFNGFLLALDKTTGAPANNDLPVFTSPLNITTVVGVPFDYTFTATNNPTSFSAAALPPGLTYNAGKIVGTPTTAETSHVVISATNSIGTTHGMLTINAMLDQVARVSPPVIQGYGAQGQLVAIDVSGNKYVTGHFSGIRDFNPGPGADVRKASSTSAFVTRFNADGSYAWTQTLTGVHHSIGLAVATDGTSVYVTGRFTSSASIGPTGTPFNSINGTDDVFVIALNCADGSARSGWGRSGTGLQTFGGTANDCGYGILTDGVCVFVTGSFSGSAQIGTTGTTINSIGGNDVFVMALNCSDGAARSSWGYSGSGIQTFGGTSNDVGYGIATNGTSLYVTGSFQSSAQIGATGTAITGAGNFDAFVIALNGSDGAATTGWGRSGSGIQTFGGTTDDIGYGIATDGTTVYATGSFRGSARIGAAGTVITSAGGSDAFVIALNCSDGSARSSWGSSSSGIQTCGGTNDDYSYGIATDGSALFATGGFGGSDVRIGAEGNSVYGSTAFVFALNCMDGAAKSAWGSFGSGIQRFGGLNATDHGGGVATYGSHVYARGIFIGKESGIGGNGTFDSTGFGGFLLDLDTSTGWSAQEIYFEIEGDIKGPVYSQVQKHPFNVRITAKDASGRVITGFNNSVIISSTGILSQGAGTTANFVNGVLAAHSVTYTSPGQFLLHAADTTGGVGTSNIFLVKPNVAPLIAEGAGPINATCDEDNTPSAFGLTLHASDTEDDVITWSISVQAAHGIATVSGTGPSKAINFEPFANYNGSDSFTVHVSDGFGGTSFIVVSVTINPVNDSPSNSVKPSISGTRYIGQFLTASEGTWSDGLDLVPGNLTYTYQWQRADDTSGTNAIDIAGATTSTYALDTSDIGKCVRVKVTATDDGEGLPASTTEASAYVYVAPIIVENPGPIAVAMDEDSAPLAFSLTLNATYAEGSLITWSISNAATCGIASVSGTGLSKAISYTPNANYNGFDSFTVQVRDALGGTDTIAVEVTINPRNDAPVNSIAPSISGTLNVGQTLIADDGTWNDDVDLTPGTITFSYQWQRANDASGTNAADIGGQTASTYTLTSDDSGRYISVKVTATDNGEGLPDIQSTTLASAYVSISNAAPVITEGNGPISSNIDEDSTPIAFSLTLNATDADNDTITWSISNAATHGTASASGTGLSKAISYSPTANYSGSDSFTVQVSDGLGGTDTIVVNVTISPRNDAPAISPQSFTLAENSANGTAVGTAAASDVDAGQTLSFAITAGNTGNAFAINANTGQLTVTGLAFLDYENRPQYNLTVQVTDSHGSPLSALATMTVNLTDLNEAPFFDPPDATESIAENSPAGTQVTFLFVGDVDEGQKLTLAIIAGNTGNAFELKPTAVGYDLDLRVANPAALDYETNKQFTLTVQVTDDHNPPLSATTTLIINLTDVNDAPVIAAQTFSLPENSSGGKVVGTVPAGDADAAQTLSYAIIAGNTGNAFVINSSTGQITVATASVLDFENTPSFSLSIQVTDNGGTPLSSSATVTVNLTDVGEAPSITSAATASVTTAGVGQTVTFSVGATDPTGAVSITWDFGDTILGSGSSTTHNYSAPGVYNVKATVSNAAGITVESNLTLTVVEPQFGTGLDSDGDGFSDELEIVAGSNPFSAIESPVGPAAAAPPLSLELLKMAIKLNFRMTSSDSIQISGVLPVPAGFSVTGQKVTVDVGGVLKNFTLNDKGKSPKTNDTFIMTVKAKNGMVIQQNAKFQLKLKKGNFDDALADEGLIGASDLKNAIRSVRVDFIFNQSTFRKDQAQTYTAKTGKSGVTKIPR